MRQSDITIRRTVADDVDDIGRIYAQHVQAGVATFELTAPDEVEWLRRLRSATDGGLPFLTATLEIESSPPLKSVEKVVSREPAVP